jgi:hypothetical protein
MSSVRILLHHLEVFMGPLDANPEFAAQNPARVEE